MDINQIFDTVVAYVAIALVRVAVLGGLIGAAFLVLRYLLVWAIDTAEDFFSVLRWVSSACLYLFAYKRKPDHELFEEFHRWREECRKKEEGSKHGS